MPNRVILGLILIVWIGAVVFYPNQIQAYCSGKVTAARVRTCKWVSSSNKTTESYYCAVDTTDNGPWSCTGSAATNCRASFGSSGQSCPSVNGVGNCTCACKTGTQTIAGNCSSPSAQGAPCGSGLPYAGSCQCQCSPPLSPGNCLPVGGGGSMNCWVNDPTVTPKPGPTNTPKPPGPTSTPKPPQPTLTNSPKLTPTRIPTVTLKPSSTPSPTNPPPTAIPAIIGHIYDDPNDGTVAVNFAGNQCLKIGGAAPTSANFNNAKIKAVRNGIDSAGLISGSSYTITTGLVSGATNYQVVLILPTPASTSTMSYVCGCPRDLDNEYVCTLTSVSANGSPNFFVRKNTLANAWWQTVGGSVYAKDEIQTQIPVSTCDLKPGCNSALIVGTGTTNTGGLAVVGEHGAVKTTTGGSSAYIQSASSRPVTGVYAVGVKLGRETTAFFKKNLQSDPLPFTSLDDLQSQVNVLAPDSTGIFMYTGQGDLVMDKKSSVLTPLTIPNTRKIVVFVPTNVKVTNSSGDSISQITTVPTTSFLMFLVSGTMTVEANVGSIDPATVPGLMTANLTGVFVADQQIVIQSDGDGASADRKFIGAGTFVAWDLAGVGNAIDLQRNFADGGSSTALNATTPTEVFVYRPDFVTHFPDELKVSHFNWREISPQRPAN